MTRAIGKRKSPMKKYVRGRTDTRYGHGDNGCGKVRIYVRLVADDSSIVKGNVSRTFTIHDAYVLDVADVVERALFG